MMVLRSGPPPRLDQALATQLALTPSVSWMFNNPPLDYELEGMINKTFGVDVSDVVDAALGRITPRPIELTNQRDILYGTGRFK